MGKSVLRENIDNFSEPSNRSEGEERLNSLEEEVGRLEKLLKGGNVADPVTGRRMEKVEYHKWVRRTTDLLKRTQREVYFLYSWITLRTVQPPSQQLINPKHAHHLLWHCGLLFRRLREEGVDFTPEELRLVDAVTKLSALKGSFLEEARGLPAWRASERLSVRCFGCPDDEQ